MELVCIVCPNGCHLTVEQTADGLRVQGNKCIRGEQYGKDEMTDPRRMVTAVVRTTDREHPCVPVKSEQPVPRGLINCVLKQIYALQVDLPVKRGDVCIDNCCDTGIAIQFTRSLNPATSGRRQ